MRMNMFRFRPQVQDSHCLGVYPATSFRKRDGKTKNSCRTRVLGHGGPIRDEVRERHPEEVERRLPAHPAHSLSRVARTLGQTTAPGTVIWWHGWHKHSKPVTTTPAPTASCSWPLATWAPLAAATKHFPWATTTCRRDRSGRLAEYRCRALRFCPQALGAHWARFWEEGP